MIQFNLLPDVKIEYVKAMRMKRMVVGAAIILTGVTFVIFLLLALVVYGVQKKTVGDLDKDIASKSKELTGTKDLDKILTIQNQLTALPALHDKKVVASRAYTFITTLIPTGVTASEYEVNFDESTMSITGAAPALDRVNVFADTLKFAKYTDGTDVQDGKPFSDVVLSQFAKTAETTNYTISLKFEPKLFSTQAPYALVIPKSATTNSVTGQPSGAIFKTDANGGGN